MQGRILHHHKLSLCRILLMFFFYAAGVTNLLTTSGSVAGGTRCTLQGEGVKNETYFKCLAPTRILLISQLNTD